MTRNKAWERILFGQPLPYEPSLPYLRQITGEQITRHVRTIETAKRMAATARSSRERAVQFFIADEARRHLRELVPFMTREQKKRVLLVLEKSD